METAKLGTDENREAFVPVIEWKMDTSWPQDEKREGQRPRVWWVGGAVGSRFCRACRSLS